MSRVTTWAAAAVCSLTLAVGARGDGTDSNAPPSGSPRAIAIEVLIVGTAGDAKGDEVVGLSGPSREVTTRLAKLESDGQITVIDRIRMTVIEDQEAMVQVGKSAPVARGRSSAARGGPPQMSYQYQEFGTLMSAIARVDGAAVVVELQVEKSQLEQPAETPEADGGFTPTSTGTLSSQATMRIEDGQTVLAGGMESRSGGKSSGQLVLASARVLDASRGDVGSAIAPRQIPAKDAAKALAQVMGDSADGVQVEVLESTGTLILRGEKGNVELAQALLSPPQAGPSAESEPRRSGAARRRPSPGIGQWLKTGSWVTLANDQGGYRIRVMTDEQKARAEKAAGEYDEQMAKYRQYMVQSHRPNTDPSAERPARVEVPRLALDLRRGQFLRIASVAGDLVELQGDDVHVIVPLSSIHLILIGDTGDVSNTTSRARSAAIEAAIRAGRGG